LYFLKKNFNLNKVLLKEKVMKKTILSLVLVSLLASGCATDPYTGESKVSKTAWGTGIGTAVGAGVGALVGGKKGALVGAAIGAGGGALTGGYMDLQARELRQQLTGTGVQVQTLENGYIVLIMPENVTFAFNSYVFQPKFNQVLDSVALVLKKYDKTRVMVSGYTDNVGKAAYNMELSQKRAKAVADYLQLRGVSAARMVVSGMGMSNPIASNETNEGRAQNRRVEITLIPMQ